MRATRRGVIGGTGAAGLAAAVSSPAAAQTLDEAWHQKVLERFASYGVKASGGPGDDAAGAWLQEELTRAGYACSRQTFQTPFFEPRVATLTAGGARAEVIPQAVVVPTGPGGVSGPLRPASSSGPLTDAIVLVVLPYRRWSSSIEPFIAGRLKDAFDRGAKAVVMVTTGPSGEALALNARPDKPAFNKPVAVLAPRDAEPFVAAAARGERSVLTVDGRGGRRPAWNLIGRLNRGAARSFILSTPRSGWFTSAGERGSGVSVWLSLALWAAREVRNLNIEVIATSGHEYEYQGGEEYIAHASPPPPTRTRLWLHVGANAASRDWHEFGGVVSRPLPGPDSQRVLMASAPLVPALTRAFKGIAGLEAVYTADPATVAGELGNVFKAGYDPAMGLFGSHRFHHARGDDMRCTSGALVRPVSDAFRAVLSMLLY